jgi:hypothetical protein
MSRILPIFGHTLRKGLILPALKLIFQISMILSCFLRPKVPNFTEIEKRLFGEERSRNQQRCEGMAGNFDFWRISLSGSGTASWPLLKGLQAHREVWARSIQGLSVHNLIFSKERLVESAFDSLVLSTSTLGIGARIPHTNSYSPALLPRYPAQYLIV